MEIRNNRVPTVLICASLVLAILTAYWPIFRCEFINYDDQEYVTDNPVVLQGLTAKGIAWAFRTTHAANWHPLTWLSHMLDVQIFGLRARGHHLVNLLFHTANALLLFFGLKRLTGLELRSAFVACLFALHPLHVESVAWVAERKDVLSTFFGLLSLWAYTIYAQSKIGGTKSEVRGPRSERTATAIESSRARGYYLMALGMYMLSLMSKQMLVTLPFLMLLLDYWPLRRLEAKTRKSGPATAYVLIREKLPFAALSLASSVVAFMVQRQAAAMASLKSLSAGERISNALVSCLLYLQKTIWPSRLAVIYPLPASIPGWQAAMAAGLVFALTLWVLSAQKRPYLLVGWFWFLGMLVPVIGLVQVGTQAMADRYSYLPLVGIFVALCWGIADAFGKWRHGPGILAVGTAIVLAVCIVISRRQVSYWRDSVSLFERTIALTKDNYMALDSLGAALERQDRLEAAVQCLEAALVIRPDFVLAHYDLGTALARQGAKLDEAERHFLRVLEIQPNHARAHHNLASVFALEGKLEAAIAHYREALRLNPDYAEARENLAGVVARRQQWEAAASDYDLGAALLKEQRTREAIGRFQNAVRLRPDWPEVLNNLAWLLATHPSAEIRDGPQAVLLAERACELSGRTNLWLVSTLAAAYAEVGRFPDAIKAQQDVCDLAVSRPEAAQAEALHQRLELYRSGHAYHQPPN